MPLKLVQTKKTPTLNDKVEFIVRQLWEDETFQSYLLAVYDAQAVEGSLASDDAMAAMMIRDQAKKNGDEDVAGQQIATIVRALNVVLRRYNQSRKTRRQGVFNDPQ